VFNSNDLALFSEIFACDRQQTDGRTDGQHSSLLLVAPLLTGEIISLGFRRFARFGLRIAMAVSFFSAELMLLGIKLSCAYTNK